MVKQGNALNKDVVYALIRSCQECKHCYQARYYTADSWEQLMAWNCWHPKLKSRENATTDREKWKSPPGIGILDDSEEPAIPKWCPLRKTRQ